MNENIVKLEKWIKESDNIVFFGGAGVSTESTVAPSGIVTVMFVSGIVYVFDDALSAKAGRQKTTASMKTASRQPIKRMLFL